MMRGCGGQRALWGQSVDAAICDDALFKNQGVATFQQQMAGRKQLLTPIAAIGGDPVLERISCIGVK